MYVRVWMLARKRESACCVIAHFVNPDLLEYYKIDIINIYFITNLTGTIRFDTFSSTTCFIIDSAIILFICLH